MKKDILQGIALPKFKRPADEEAGEVCSFFSLDIFYVRSSFDIGLLFFFFFLDS